MVKEKSITIIYGVMALLLLLCLFDMPYGFYFFVRIAATAAFCYLAYKSYNSDDKDRMILFIILAILFQPFFKIPLGRVIWIIVDVVVTAFLIYLFYEHVREGK